MQARGLSYKFWCCLILNILYIEAKCLKLYHFFFEDFSEFLVQDLRKWDTSLQGENWVCLQGCQQEFHPQLDKDN